MTPCDQGVIVEHEEMVTPLISAGTGEAYQSLIFNPGLTAYSWLSGVAARYEQYRVLHLEFFVAPAVGTDSDGLVALAPDYDVTDGQPANWAELMAMASAKATQVYNRLRIAADPRSAMGDGRYKYVRTDGGTPDRLSDACRLWIGLTGISAGTFGQLYVRYKLQLRTEHVDLVAPVPDSTAIFAGAAEPWPAQILSPSVTFPLEWHTQRPDDGVTLIGTLPSADFELAAGQWRIQATLTAMYDVSAAAPNACIGGTELLLLAGVTVLDSGISSAYMYDNGGTTEYRVHLTMDAVLNVTDPAQVYRISALLASSVVGVNGSVLAGTARMQLLGELPPSLVVPFEGDGRAGLCTRGAALRTPHAEPRRRETTAARAARYQALVDTACELAKRRRVPIKRAAPCPDAPAAAAPPSAAESAPPADNVQPTA